MSPLELVLVTLLSAALVVVFLWVALLSLIFWTAKSSGLPPTHRMDEHPDPKQVPAARLAPAADPLAHQVSLREVRGCAFCRRVRRFLVREFKGKQIKV